VLLVQVLNFYYLATERYSFRESVLASQLVRVRSSCCAALCCRLRRLLLRCSWCPMFPSVSGD
jgi:hypothetical protein